MKKALAILAALLALVVTPLSAQEDDDFFDDAAVEVDKADKETNVDEDLDKESVTLTGNIEASGSYTLSRDFLWGLADMDDNSLSYLLTGDFLVDVRLRKGFRAFTDVSIGYTNVGMPVYHTYNLLGLVTVYDGNLPPAPIGVILPNVLFLVSENQDMAIGIKELFVDFNIANAVYFRVGKQVLQWGRGYLWNPTDLINIEKKSFLNLDALRDGTFGLRTDFVFDRAFHLFTFVQFQNAEDFSDMAVAGKAEFLIGSVETSLSAWWKGGKIPVFGWDVSAPLFWDLDFRGEIAVSWGDNLDRLGADGTTVTQVRDRLVPRFSVGLSRGFDVGDVEDRVMVTAEFYYNDSGYGDNMFQALEGLAEPTRTMALQSFYAQYYDPGSYGRFYGALFVMINKFLIDQFTLTLSGMGNLSDLSFIAAANLAYTPVYNFTMSFRLIAYLGENLREYMVAPAMTGTSIDLKNNLIGASITCSVKF